MAVGFPGDRIKIACATTGTGATIATNGAAVSTMFATVAEAGLVNATDYHYIIEQGSDWEHSTGVYTSAGSTIGRTVVASKVGGTYGTTKINLNGTQVVYFPLFKALTDLFAQTANISATLANVREKLGGNRTYYVRSDGNDGNVGTTDSAGGAYLTIQRAFNAVMNGLDLNGWDVTIQVRTGTYSYCYTLGPWVGRGTVFLVGDTTTPSNCLISTAANYGIAVYFNRLTIGGFRFLGASGSGSAIYASNHSTVELNGKCEFGSQPWYHLHVDNGSIIYSNGVSHNVSGGAYAFAVADVNSRVNVTNGTITLSNTPAWGVAFAAVWEMSDVRMNGLTFTGTGATGKRYECLHNSILFTGNDANTYLPGNTNGTLGQDSQNF